jgi:ribosomal RNA assembly protein
MHVKVPQDRLGVLIGKDGETKDEIESSSSVSLKIDSESGSVEVVSKSGDSIGEMRASDVVKAIARGFSPENALHLLEDEMLMLDVIEIPAASPSELKRISGRIIGKKGKTRRIMEELTNTMISVYGKTVSIIGFPEQISVVHSALNLLIEGSAHASVYTFLERKRSETKRML